MREGYSVAKLEGAKRHSEQDDHTNKPMVSVSDEEIKLMRLGVIKDIPALFEFRASVADDAGRKEDEAKARRDSPAKVRESRGIWRAWAWIFLIVSGGLTIALYLQIKGTTALYAQYEDERYKREIYELHESGEISSARLDLDIAKYREKALGRELKKTKMALAVEKDIAAGCLKAAGL